MGAIFVLIAIDWAQRDKAHGLSQLPFPLSVRLSTYCILCLAVIEFFFGRGEFIYFQF